MTDKAFVQTVQTENQTLTKPGRKTETVTIKGTPGGLLVRLRDDSSVEWNQMLTELAARLQSGERFFRGARAALDLGRREFQSQELNALLQVLQKYEVQLEHIVSGANATRAVAKQAGIEFKLPNNFNTRPPVPDVVTSEAANENTGGSGMPFDTAEALFMRRTLRSGQVIRHHADVCLLGDVNPGAEIVAGGNIIIWGSLRGAVWAGANKDSTSMAGSSQAVVCALQLNAMQLNIGDLVTHAPENAVNLPLIGPEVAYISNGKIIVEPWLPGKKILPPGGTS